MREKLSLYKIPLILGAGSVFFIATSLFLLIKTYQSNTPIKFSGSAGEASISGQASDGIVVDVQGAVNIPGVYRLPIGARVDDALLAACVLAQDADSDRIAKTINRAMILSDGMKLYIPVKGETQGVATSQGAQTEGGVSVNLATQAQLEALSGIGPVTAGKIIDNRPYMSLEELVIKKALSRSLFEKLKDQLTL